MLKKTYECFSVSIEDKIAHIKLNRPDAMNAMNKAFWNELPEIVKDIDNGAKARVIVISSTGKHFSAGMDLSVFAGDGRAKRPIAMLQPRHFGQISGKSSPPSIVWKKPECRSCLPVRAA